MSHSPHKILWVENVAKAIEFLYSKRVLHGDILYNNTFIDSELNAKARDLAHSSINGLPFLTNYGTSHPLPGDMSVSVKPELFALNSTFFEIMTGSGPLECIEDSTMESFFSEGSFLDVETLPTPCSVILRCWRGLYYAAEEVHRALEEGIASSDIWLAKANEDRTQEGHFSSVKPQIDALMAVYISAAFSLRYPAHYPIG